MTDEARAPKPPEQNVKCFCGSPMELRHSRKYNRWFYGCVKYPKCDGVISVHGMSGDPVGTAAEKEVREWRRMAHLEFDSLWKSGRMFRQTAYSWMQKTMGLTMAQAHVGLFDETQCRRLVAEVHLFWDQPENQYFLKEVENAKG